MKRYFSPLVLMFVIVGCGTDLSDYPQGVELTMSEPTEQESLLLATEERAREEHGEAPVYFLRGDANNDGKLTRADREAFIFGVKFPRELVCPAVLDVDLNKRINKDDFHVFVKALEKYIKEDGDYPLPWREQLRIKKRDCKRIEGL